MLGALRFTCALLGKTTTTTPMKPIVYILTGMFLIVTAEARNNGLSPKAKEKIKQEEAQKKKDKEDREKKREAIDKLLEAKDTNHDGSLSLDEYTAKESDIAAATKKFDEFNKNHDRYLSKMEMGELLGL